MRPLTLQLAFAIVVATLTPITANAQRPARGSRQPAAPHRAPKGLPCGDYQSFQVLLDRQGFSVGQIDGLAGTNFAHALAAFQTARQLPSSEPSCETWRALNGESAEPTLTTYTITGEDVKGPFQKNIPRSLVQQAELSDLGYKSPLELISERFHASPGLLQRLNPRAAFAEGDQIRVPAVVPFDPDTKPTFDPANANLVIQVSREDSALRAQRPDGTVVFFAPVTTGSEHDPLPTGDYKVTGVSWRPTFQYNPELFWDANPKDTKAAIKPGPNNPVGVVWIALSLEHYGLHGTPEPGNVAHTESHGCVRLTNWDAARLAGLVKPGTAVQFR